jgi:cytochrome c oxidase cbb3-type subunit III
MTGLPRPARAWRGGFAVMVAVWLSTLGFAQGTAPAPAGAKPAGGPPPQAASPASRRPPVTKAPQKYPPEQIAAGAGRFASQCGFCHGRDAAGGESGPDLTRSQLVADDVRGDLIGPVVLKGRADKGMPPIAMSAADLAAVVAFIHDAKVKAESSSGGRRSVDVEDLQTGDPVAGQRYFNGAGGCARCHTISGPFASVGARYQGLALLQRLLYPGSGGRGAGPPPAPPAVKVTTPSGETVSGTLVYQDEFTVSLTDAAGWVRSFSKSHAAVTVDDPRRAHIDQLAKYSDEEMHNVLAYLQTLR